MEGWTGCEKTVSEPLRVMKGEKELDNKRGEAKM